MDRVLLDANLLFVASYRDQAPLTCLWQLAGVRLLTSAYVLGEAWHHGRGPARPPGRARRRLGAGRRAA